MFSSCILGTLNCSTWDLVPWPGIEPRRPALGVRSHSHWTIREVTHCFWVLQIVTVLNQPLKQNIINNRRRIAFAGSLNSSVNTCTCMFLHTNIVIGNREIIYFIIIYSKGSWVFTLGWVHPLSQGLKIPLQGGSFRWLAGWRGLWAVSSARAVASPHGPPLGCLAEFQERASQENKVEVHGIWASLWFRW